MGKYQDNIIKGMVNVMKKMANKSEDDGNYVYAYNVRVFRGFMGERDGRVTLELYVNEDNEWFMFNVLDSEDGYEVCDLRTREMRWLYHALLRDYGKKMAYAK